MIIVTNQMFENQFLTGLQQNLESELTDTEEVSTGHKVNQPSDDPAALVQIVGYKTQLSAITQYQNAIISAKSPLQSLDTSLSNLSNTLERANELAIGAVSGTPDPQSMLAVADEVQQLSGTAVSIANTNVNGQYIFAGDNSNVNPINPNTGELMSDNNSMSQNIGVGVNVTTNVQAGSLFSFARVNGNADSTTAILPTYNWPNAGANTIPDADPVSALETTPGSAASYYSSGTSTSGLPTAYVGANSTFISSGDIFTPNGGALNIAVGNSTTPSSGAFVINNSNNTIKTSSGTFNITNGIYTGSGLAAALQGSGAGINVTYDSTQHKFTIASNPAANVDWSAVDDIGKILGFSSAGVQAVGSGITSDNAVGDVNLAAGSTLQDVRDAVNTAGAGVKAQVVNKGTTATPDFRLVVASAPAGNSANIDISPLLGSSDPSGTGVNMLSYNDAGTNNNMILGTNITNYNYITQASANDSIVIDDGTNGNIANNQILVTVGGTQETAAIARGTYTHDQLATAVENALDTAANVATGVPGQDTYNVTYDPNAKKFTIAGNASNPDLTTLDWSSKNSTAGPLLGYNATNESGAITIGAGSNTIGFNDGANRTATVASGTYTSGTDLAAAIQSALNDTAVTGSAVNNFVVNYDSTTNTFAVSTSTAHAGLSILWTGAGSGTLNEAQVGFSVASSPVTTNPATATSSSSVSIDGQSDNSVVANYYSFNNNYLNDKYILRALNFEQQSLKNNDSGRVQQAIQYTSDLTASVSQTQSQIGATEDKVNTESSQQENSQTNIQIFLSQTQDTDLASVVSDLSLRQTALQALRTITSDVLNQSLFDFIKSS